MPSANFENQPTAKNKTWSDLTSISDIIKDLQSSESDRRQAAAKTACRSFILSAPESERTRLVSQLSQMLSPPENLGVSMDASLALAQLAPSRDELKQYVIQSIRTGDDRPGAPRLHSLELIVSFELLNFDSAIADAVVICLGSASGLVRRHAIEALTTGGVVQENILAQLQQFGQSPTLDKSDIELLRDKQSALEWVKFLREQE